MRYVYLAMLDELFWEFMREHDWHDSHEKKFTMEEMLNEIKKMKFSKEL